MLVSKVRHGGLFKSGLPAVRPSVGGTNIGLCSKVSKARIHSTSEQSALSALKVHPQILNCEKAQPVGTGIVRFARAVLAYVGAGLSAVTANQFGGPSILQAKELGGSVGANHTIGTTEVGGMWQRNSGSRHVVQEDVIRPPKLGHCPVSPIVPKRQTDPSYALGHSYYWSHSLGPMDVRYSPDAKGDSQWLSSPSTTNKDYRSKLGGLEEGLSSRFSKPTGLQALAAESSSFSLKNNTGPMGAVSDYNPTADFELDWQFIVDPKCRAGLETPISEEGEEVTFEEVVGTNIKQDGPEKIKLVNSCDVGSSEIRTISRDLGKHNVEIMTKTDEEIMTKTNKKIMTPIARLDEGIDEQIVTSKQEFVSQEITDRHGMDYLSSMENSLLWRATDKENPIPFDGKKTAEQEEDSELPTSSAQSLSTTLLSSFDIVDKAGDSIRSLDQGLLTAILHRSEPTRLENSSLPSSAILPESPCPTAAAGEHFQTISQPMTIPSIVARSPIRRGSCSLSADNRNTSWSGGGAMSMTADPGSGLLGEALCHSQTRAREAERKVQQAYEEQERLVRLCFREASRSLTYRHWVTSLEVENMWLRKFAPNESLAWLHRSFLDPFSSMGQMSRRSWKGLDRDLQRQIQHNVSAMHKKDGVELGESSSNDMVMGCTLGIAFALGLSLAGAGLVIGWSMGWILLAYSVSV